MRNLHTVTKEFLHTQEPFSSGKEVINTVSIHQDLVGLKSFSHEKTIEAYYVATPLHPFSFLLENWPNGYWQLPLQPGVLTWEPRRISCLVSCDCKIFSSRMKQDGKSIWAHRLLPLESRTTRNILVKVMSIPYLSFAVWAYSLFDFILSKNSDCLLWHVYFYLEVCCEKQCVRLCQQI